MLLCFHLNVETAAPLPSQNLTSSPTMSPTLQNTTSPSSSPTLAPTTSPLKSGYVQLKTALGPPDFCLEVYMDYNDTVPQNFAVLELAVCQENATYTAPQQLFYLDASGYIRIGIQNQMCVEMDPLFPDWAPGQAFVYTPCQDVWSLLPDGSLKNVGDEFHFCMAVEDSKAFRFAAAVLENCTGSDNQIWIAT